MQKANRNDLERLLIGVAAVMFACAQLPAVVPAATSSRAKPSQPAVTAIPTPQPTAQPSTPPLATMPAAETTAEPDEVMDEVQVAELTAEPVQAKTDE